MNKATRILVSGTYFSGSSAVTDFLSEFDGVCRIPGEFDDFRRIGLVGDSLDASIVPYPLRFNDYILKKRSYSFISNVFGGSTGRRAAAHRLIDRFFDSLLTFRGLKRANLNGLDFLQSYAQKIQSVDSPEVKLGLAKDWLCEVEESILNSKSYKYVLYDQPIFHGQHQNIWPKVFEPFKLIVVIRNPLDQMAQLIGNGNYHLDHHTCLTHGLHEIYGSDTSGMINYQLAALCGRYRSILKLAEILPKDQMMIVSFEELVDQYDEITDNLLKYITDGKMDVKHSQPMKFFDPNMSRRNIGIKKEFNQQLQSVDQEMLREVMGLHGELLDS